MCAIFGFMDYKGLVGNAALKKLVKELSICAEVRGMDATGISYVKNGKLTTFKKAKPAHKVKLYFPKNTQAVIGHTRMTTQGSERFNYNNHPFESKLGFALAHNGVLYNDKELRIAEKLPETQIETDSYIAVQLLEKYGTVSLATIQKLCEKLDGSFTFSILKKDNTLYLAKGSNPIAIYHFHDMGLYVYASTKNILEEALQASGFQKSYAEIPLQDGEILQINSDGTTAKTIFAMQEWDNSFWNFEEFDETEKQLLEYSKLFGVAEEEVQMLLEFGYSVEEIEEFLMSPTLFASAVADAEEQFGL